MLVTYFVSGKKIYVNKDLQFAKFYNQHKI